MTMPLPLQFARALIVLALLPTLHAPSQAGQALCPAVAPAQGTAVRGVAPLFPPDNWWNLDIRQAPVDPQSAAYIAFINNGGTRRLHPDFGGTESPGSVAIYGMPYAVVDAGQPKLPVTFLYADESDGVDTLTGQPRPFYPIPTQAVTQPHWVEGGAAAGVDQRNAGDRHLLMVDCANNHLYELYNVFYDGAQGRWYGGSGAFFDMNTNGRRPTGWTSADAAGLAIFPGLVRHDEVYDPAVTDIGHAFRVTVRATNGYVWPASHRAGSTPGALPLGARLRLKATVGGADPALRSADPQMRKIFRAMQTHGLIVADNGSDLYVTGTFDTRWNNDILNPAFALLGASDFEVVQLGWNPVGVVPVLAALAVQPATLAGGAPATGQVSLSAAAPAGGAVVALASNQAAVRVPSSVSVAQGATTASFTITTTAVSARTAGVVSATWQGVTRSATLTVDPAPSPPVLRALAVTPTRIVGGQAAYARITLSAPALAGGQAVLLASSRGSLLQVPARVTVPPGEVGIDVPITTTATRSDRAVTVTATHDRRRLAVKVVVTRR